LRRKNKSFTLFSVFILCAAAFALISCSGPTAGLESTVAPAPPKELRFETVDQGLLVSWPTVVGASKYTLFWGPEKSEYRRIVETTSPAVIIKGLPNGPLNYFAVTASTPHVESAFSKETPYVYDTDPKNASNHLQIALQLENTGNFIEALVHLATAIKLDSNNPEFHCKSAGIMKRLRMDTEAKKDLVTAEQLCAKGRHLSKNRPDNLVSVVHGQF
jgi:hypothetical protein